MKHTLLTDAQLRAQWTCTQTREVWVHPGTVVTPAAQDFLKDHHITLRTAQQTMHKTPIPVAQGAPCYVDAVTGEPLAEKPETMTHLQGNRLVEKSHPSIALRGKLDSLIAQILEAQYLAQEDPALLKGLTQVLEYTYAILGAEVKQAPLPEINLLGLDSVGLRHQSHFVKETLGIDHPIPHYTMGLVCLKLNTLRTQVREAELAAVAAFTQLDGTCQRQDILEGLNRLSSCVYILFCQRYAKEGGVNPCSITANKTFVTL